MTYVPSNSPFSLTQVIRSGESGGGGDFLARLLVFKGEEGRLSETGWVIVE
jgi:hypothetical protein